MKCLLWLDDGRDPCHPDWMNWLSQYAPIEGFYEVVWLKNYSDFVAYIKTNGVPHGICFDHDLGDDVATEKVKNGMSKRQARREKKQSKSGMDCAKWLITYCQDNNLDVPPYAIQSQNPVGKENIKGLLESFKRFKKENA